MTMLSKTAPIVSLLILSLVLQGCGNTTPSEKTELSHDEQHAAGMAHEHHDETKNDAISMGAYQFKLSPEIMKDGETHLDFFVTSEGSNHVKGVSGTFHITKPDGSKESIPVTEESGSHYHGLANFPQKGHYQVVAELTLDGEHFNPRFEFEKQ